eukprot:832480-Prorocentrum_minimum.AAC.1
MPSDPLRRRPPTPSADALRPSLTPPLTPSGAAPRSAFAARSAANYADTLRALGAVDCDSSSGASLFGARRAKGGGFRGTGGGFTAKGGGLTAKGGGFRAKGGGFRGIGGGLTAKGGGFRGTGGGFRAKGGGIRGTG